MSKFRFAIDRGGTFTDVYAICPGNKIVTLKLLSVDPSNYDDAPSEAIRRILESETGIPRIDSKIDTSRIECIRMGTTVATNALLERKGEPTVLCVTAGFKDILKIGNQSRPDIFDLKVSKPEVLYQSVIEIDERVVLEHPLAEFQVGRKIKTQSGQVVEIWKDLDQDKIKSDLANILSTTKITSIAIVLLNSYIYPDHELKVAEIAKQVGFKYVTMSHQVMPMIKIVPRGLTTTADAFLTPHVKKYISGFTKNFADQDKTLSSDNLSATGSNLPISDNLSSSDMKVHFMQSDGGLCPVSSFKGSRAILSGPAGGVIGIAVAAKIELGENHPPIIGFDMGGTSTDVSRYTYGNLDHTYESMISGIMIQVPQLDIQTVAAGGGSTLTYRSGLFKVGPESAGAYPGPASYQNGGPLTVTDANLFLGRILPEFFPQIFGPNKNLPLDRKIVEQKFQDLSNQINLSPEQTAMGFIRVANEAMSRPIRNITEGKGHDSSNHVLACFGGAGGQHACAIARSLNIKTIFIHKYSGILSAYGLAAAKVVKELQEPVSLEFQESNFEIIDSRFQILARKCSQNLSDQGFTQDQISIEYYLNLRYDKTDFPLMISSNTGAQNSKIPIDSGAKICASGNFISSFISKYQTEFGFSLKGRKVLVDDIRVRAEGQSEFEVQKVLEHSSDPPMVIKVSKVYFEDKYLDTKIYDMKNLKAGNEILGPAIIIDNNGTIIIEPGFVAHVTKHGNIIIKISEDNQDKNLSRTSVDLDNIQLSIFSHRFMSIAEQMGRVLQRTATSTNIKERLDFSCALFGPDGALVSNAPHIPVHLGAMQKAVQYQLITLGDEIHRGDVILSNHPIAGGSHLPDLTVITPVFEEITSRLGSQDSKSQSADLQSRSKILFFVASRGHHADIGGATPGSMPPNSKTIFEEGATFISFKLVKGGIFQESDLRHALMAPAKLPNCSGSRCLEDCISDLKAQIAANNKGIKLVHQMIRDHGLDAVQAYMGHIQANAEVAVREMLKQVCQDRKITSAGDQTTDKHLTGSDKHLTGSDKHLTGSDKHLTGSDKHLSSSHSDTVILQADDYLDDGTKISLKITINPKTGDAVFDFDGTGLQVIGNLNTPTAVVLSAIIYCLRSLIGYDVPLNQGCLKPIKINIPSGSILSPSSDAAVVGGNILTSQRVVDVILKCFLSVSASQGCMNNITFGDNNLGYYETVAGGSGAGPNWHGTSGVHSHMTNTRITDPEIIEKRYAAMVNKFTLRAHSGGKGKFNGGDGVIRELLFRKNFVLSILTERRVFAPYGLKGGQDGKKGRNTLIKIDGTKINLGSKCCLDVSPGDIFLLETPGGGGYGVLNQD